MRQMFRPATFGLPGIAPAVKFGFSKQTGSRKPAFGQPQHVQPVRISLRRTQLNESGNSFRQTGESNDTFFRILMIFLQFLCKPNRHSQKSLAEYVKVCGLVKLNEAESRFALRTTQYLRATCQTLLTVSKIISSVSNLPANNRAQDLRIQNRFVRAAPQII